MRTYILIFAIFFIGGIALIMTMNGAEKMTTGKAGNIYQFTAKSIDGDDIKLSDYKGKVVLIVNVASKCGYTYQYKNLEEMYKKYKDKGLVILGFPCNQFGSQEPGTEEEIKEFCSVNYGVTFPMFSKIDVNGENAHPLYKYLTKGFDETLGTDDIKWNFTKFIVNKSGMPVERIPHKVKPEEFEDKIVKLLEEN